MGATKTTKMKNYVPRRTYRERGQLERRQHLGILEKNKDFKVRATDYKNKEAIIKNLSLKAQLRNPDEYYHKMNRMKKHDDSGEAQFDRKPLNKMEKTNQAKARKIEENQNIALVNMKREIEKKKAERLGNNLHLIDFQKQNTHITFVNNLKEIKKENETIKISDIENPESSFNLSRDKEEQFINLLRSQQSENKQQYKKLADAMLKQNQYNKVSEALTMDKLMK
jgi:U3 small nucleolar RNA-associated protein 11